jgi:hypothetical protein
MMFWPSWQEARPFDPVRFPCVVPLPPQRPHATEVAADAPHGFRGIRVEFKTEEAHEPLQVGAVPVLAQDQEPAYERR